MKVKNLLLTTALLLGASSAWADNTLSVSDAYITPSGKTAIAIEANFEKADFVGYQLEIELPDGVKADAEAGSEAKAFANGFSGTDHGIAASNPSGNLYRVVVSSNAKNMIPSGKFTLLEMRIVGDAALTNGASLNATVKNITFSDANNVGANLAEAAFKIGVSSKIILDEESAAAPVATTAAADILVKRTINANEWSTICLPFPMPAVKWKAAFGNDALIYSLKGYTKDGNTIKVTFGDKVTAAMKTCTPYIIKTSKDIKEFDVNATITITQANLKNVIMAEDEETGDELETAYMEGILKANTTIPANNLFLEKGNFRYSAGKTISKAFRADFWLKDAAAESRIVFAFDEATGIKNAKIANDEKIFDLQGRQIENAGKGIYIKGGKKVVIK